MSRLPLPQKASSGVDQGTNVSSSGRPIGNAMRLAEFDQSNKLHSIEVRVNQTQDAVLALSDKLDRLESLMADLLSELRSRDASGGLSIGTAVHTAPTPLRPMDASSINSGPADYDMMSNPDSGSGAATPRSDRGHRTPQSQAQTLRTYGAGARSLLAPMAAASISEYRGVSRGIHSAQAQASSRTEEEAYLKSFFPARTDLHCRLLMGMCNTIAQQAEKMSYIGALDPMSKSYNKVKVAISTLAKHRMIPLQDRKDSSFRSVARSMAVKDKDTYSGIGPSTFVTMSNNSATIEVARTFKTIVSQLKEVPECLPEPCASIVELIDVSITRSSSAFAIDYERLVDRLSPSSRTERMSSKIPHAMMASYVYVRLMTNLGPTEALIKAAETLGQSTSVRGSSVAPSVA